MHTIVHHLGGLGGMPPPPRKFRPSEILPLTGLEKFMGYRVTVRAITTGHTVHETRI